MRWRQWSWWCWLLPNGLVSPWPTWASSQALRPTRPPPHWPYLSLHTATHCSALQGPTLPQCPALNNRPPHIPRPLCNLLQMCATVSSTLQHNALQCSTLQCSTLQCRTRQIKTVNNTFNNPTSNASHYTIELLCANYFKLKLNNIINSIKVFINSINNIKTICTTVSKLPRNKVLSGEGQTWPMCENVSASGPLSHPTTLSSRS